MYSKLKKYMIGEALENAKTIFDSAKVELLFHIIVIHFVTYFFGSLPAIMGGYWTIVLVLFVGFMFIVILALVLQRFQKVYVPQRIWMCHAIYFTLSSALLNSGEASYITFSFVIFNTVIAFFLLDRLSRNLIVLYFSILIIVTISITFELLPKIVLPFDLAREHEFFRQPNISAILIAAVMVAFIVDRFARSHLFAGQQMIEQKEKVIQHKELLEKKINTMKSSLQIASKLQQEISIDWSEIDSHFSAYFHFKLPKENLSGEFFWVKKRDKVVYFALVDTGEFGVAGAMLSFSVRNALERALGVRIENDTDYSLQDILKSVDGFLHNSVLASIGFETSVKITLCKFTYLTNELNVAGVTESLLIEEKGKLKTFEASNLNYINVETPFDEVTANLASGDIIYLFSDGVATRIENKQDELKDYSEFKSLLKSSSKEILENKSAIIKSTYLSKKEKGLQTGDVTIVGLKVE